jgi:hypothetical protein
MTVDTLEISKKLEAAGMPKSQAEAITEILGSLAHDELVTRDYLDRRLLQHPLTIIGAVAGVAGLFKLFG